MMLILTSIFCIFDRKPTNDNTSVKAHLSIRVRYLTVSKLIGCVNVISACLCI